MANPSPAARIYLANKRKTTQTDSALMKTTHFFDSTSSAIICSVQDIQLVAQKSWTLETQANHIYFLLPLVGGIELQENSKDSFFVLNGQLFQYQNGQAGTLTFINPYDQNDLRFLLLSIKQEELGLPVNHTINLPIGQQKNQLLTITANQVKLGFGQYDGRAETTYHAPQSALLLGYAVQGAFEFENRLLESGDGVSLWNTTEIEWEALSNNALLMFVELSS